MSSAMIVALATLPAGSSAGCVPEDGRDERYEDRADGDTLFVSPAVGSNDACTSNDPCSIEEAIDRAMAGDHIVFKNGTYCEGATECPIDCHGGNNCDQLSCTDGAACTVDCTDANNCSFSTCDHPDGQIDCGGGIITCGAACPQ